MGFAIGALVTGAVADWIGIPWSIFVTAMLTFLAVLFVSFLLRFSPFFSGCGLDCQCMEHPYAILAVPHPHRDTNTHKSLHVSPTHRHTDTQKSPLSRTHTNAHTYTHTQAMLVFFFYEEVAGDDSGAEVAVIPEVPGLSLAHSLARSLLLSSFIPQG